MTDQPENPPAFPQSVHPDGPFGGMTLRDHIAVAVLTGLGTWSPDFVPLDTTKAIESRARFAYQQADAMLRERGK